MFALCLTPTLTDVGSLLRSETGKLYFCDEAATCPNNVPPAHANIFTVN